jgi:hypothetical protein
MLFLFLILLGPLLHIENAEGKSQDLFFSEDFGGTEVDTTKWVVQENPHTSKYPAYGGSVQVNGSQIYLSSNGSTFPFISSSSNPFPTTGDFTVEFNMTYSCIADLGCGVMISDGLPTFDSTWHNRIFTLWAADEGTDHGVIYIELFNNFVYFTKVAGFKPSSIEHSYKIEYSQGNYSIYVDNLNVASIESQERPNMIVLGTPPTPYIPFPPETLAASWGWSSFNIDFISVKTNSEKIQKTTEISLAGNGTPEEYLIGNKINIAGNLSSEDKPIADAEVTLSYALPNDDLWIPISSTTTNLNGSFSFSWVPTATGSLILKTEYLGDDEFSGCYAVKNISVNEGNEFFFVESNSTITSLCFNGTTSEISFTVNGTTGTTGYVKITISKNFMPNSENIKVYLDGEPINCSITPSNDSSIVVFTYHHSSHQVEISQESSSDFGFVYSEYLPYVAVGIIAALLGLLVLIVWSLKSKE